MNRRQMFAALFGLAPVAVIASSSPPALMLATPICPLCGMMPMVDRRPAFPAERVPARCTCGWRGSVPLEVAIP